MPGRLLASNAGFLGSAKPPTAFGDWPKARCSFARLSTEQELCAPLCSSPSRSALLSFQLVGPNPSFEFFTVGTVLGNFERNKPSAGGSFRSKCQSNRKMSFRRSRSGRRPWWIPTRNPLRWCRKTLRWHLFLVHLPE